MAKFTVYRTPKYNHPSEAAAAIIQPLIDLEAENTLQLCDAANELIGNMPRFVSDFLLLKVEQGLVKVYYTQINQNPKLFLKQWSCDVNCDPSDYCEGGKCDRHGCYKK